MIDHNGKILPDHAKLTDRVVVRFRDGEEALAPQTVREWHGCWTWNRRWPSDSEIVAYRVVR